MFEEGEERIMTHLELLELGFHKSNKDGVIWLFGSIGRFDGLFDAYYYSEPDKTFTINSNQHDSCEVEIEDAKHMKELLTALRLL